LLILLIFLYYVGRTPELHQRVGPTQELYW